MTDREKMRLQWERQWHRVIEKDRLTMLTRKMFVAKQRAVKEIIAGLDVSSVLEVGCGLGYILDVYVDAGLQCNGIDISERAVEFCRQKELPVNLQAVEDERQRYDLVSSDGMLEHFLNYEPIALEIMRISNKYVLLIQPNHGSFWGKTLSYLAELIRGDSIVFEYNYRIQDFVKTFEAGGFILLENVPVFGDVFRLLLFKRKCPI